MEDNLTKQTNRSTRVPENELRDADPTNGPVGSCDSRGVCSNDERATRASERVSTRRKKAKGHKLATVLVKLAKRKGWVGRLAAE